MNEPLTIYSLDKAPILHYSSTTAFPRLTTHHYNSYFSNDLVSLDPSASYKNLTIHSSSSIEDWINKTLLGTSSSTLAKAFERVPPFTQPSSPTTPLLGKRNRGLLQPDQEPQGTKLLQLTEDLLELHTKNMAGNSIQKTPTKDKAQRMDYGLPTSSSASSSPSSKTDPQWVKMRMRLHHISHHSDAFDHPDYIDFKEHILSQIVPERASAVEPAETSEFKEAYRTCVEIGANEATFKREMLEHVIKKDLQVLAAPGDPSQGIQPVYEIRDILKGGIFCEDRQPLRQGLLPHNYPIGSMSPEVLAKKLQADGMTNSVPDCTWGHLPRVLDPIPGGATLQAHTRELLTICPSLFCPFFILKVNITGSMEGCRNQAALGCATIVSAMRSLLCILGREDTVGPDKDSYIYCATMSEDFMEWWVGWAEVCEDERVMWHMSLLRMELFDQDNALQVMRRIMDNIMEWGLMTRLPIIKKLVSDLYARDTMLLADDEDMGPPDSPSPAKRLKETHPTGSGMKG